MRNWWNERRWQRPPWVCLVPPPPALRPLPLGRRQSKRLLVTVQLMSATMLLCSAGIAREV